MELQKRDDGYWWVGFQTDLGYKWRNTKATTKDEAQEICDRAKVAEIEPDVQEFRRIKQRAIGAFFVLSIVSGILGNALVQTVMGFFRKLGAG